MPDEKRLRELAEQAAKQSVFASKKADIENNMAISMILRGLADTQAGRERLAKWAAFKQPGNEETAALLREPWKVTT